VSRSVLVQETRRGKVHVCQPGVPLLVGRDAKSCRLHLDDRRISRRHCELMAEADGRLRIKDLSTYGTRIRGEPIDGVGWARLGDRLVVGKDWELDVVGLLDPDAPTRDREGWLTLPQRIPPHYLLLRAVGRGAAGVVYEAFDEDKKQRCALKLLVAGGPATDELIARFKREAIMQGTLRDWPGIVSVLDFGRLPDSAELFFTMDFVPGKTLRQRIKDGLSRKEGLKLVARTARAVHYAHEHGIVHRDLKPANVMVADDGAVRLTDFGVCKALEDHDGLTMTGVMLGTPNFMAPEQVDDSKRVGPAADVYGLGAILYSVAAGRVPFHGETITEILDKVVRGDLVAPIDVDPTIDDELNAICLEALAPEPEGRHESALALAKGIEAWLKKYAPKTKVHLAPPGSGSRAGEGPGTTRQ